MPKALSADAVAAFEERGYVFPIRVMDEQEIAGLRARLETLARAEGGKLSRGTNQKPHLLLPWLNDLVRHPRILDVVEDVLGPNLFCWASGFFWKPAKDPAFISWHQDSTYWGLSHPDVVTAWLAFTPSTPESGCMRVVPGSHHKDQIPHKDTFAAENMLSRGQEVAVEVDEQDAVDIVLQPGEASLHHVRLIHGSEPNRADHPRIGYAIRYLPTYVSQTTGIRDSATLVRGVDEYRHFDHEPAPSADFAPDAVAYHAAMLERSQQILYAGAAQVKPFERPAASAAR
ncbi:MAG TPA: phytanoyl-CoA dioxygenase family protein [Geminicoccaceae bacterium]|nr:phytanoyl-CoA dioxygenase family protein [Geminicoccaceae bacterium]